MKPLPSFPSLPPLPRPPFPTAARVPPSAAVHLIKFLLSSKKKGLPPSPSALPFIGYLYLLKKPLHHTLVHLADRHGPILLFRFSSHPVLVVSSASAAEECFTTNDITFANRPNLPSTKYLSNNYTTLVTASYGPHWRNLRRIATMELLSTHRLLSSTNVQAEEVREMARRVFLDSKGGTEGFVKVELKSRLFDLALNILMRMIGGKRYNGNDVGVSEAEAREFREMVEEAFSLSGTSNLGDFLPMLRWVDYQGVRKRLVRLWNWRNVFMQRLIDEHRKGNMEIKEEEKKIKINMIGDLLSLQKIDSEYYTDQTIRALGGRRMAVGFEIREVDGGQSRRDVCCSGGGKEEEGEVGRVLRRRGREEGLHRRRGRRTAAGSKMGEVDGGRRRDSCGGWGGGAGERWEGGEGG